MAGFWIFGIFIIICFLLAVAIPQEFNLKPYQFIKKTFKQLMKKLLFSLILIMAFSPYLKAQVDYQNSQANLAQRDTSKVKPKYEYFIKVPVQGYQQILQLLGECKTWMMYVPKTKLSADQKEQLFINIDNYTDNLQKQAKVDSVKKK